MANSRKNLYVVNNSDLTLNSEDGITEKESNETSEIDEIFKEIGEFGKYQFFIFVLIGFIISIAAITSYITIFTDATPDFRCKLPMLDNDTYEVTSQEQQRLIDRYIPKGSGFTRNDLECKLISNSSSNKVLANCDSWVYSKQYYEETVISKVRTNCFIIYSF